MTGAREHTTVQAGPLKLEALLCAGVGPRAGSVEQAAVVAPPHPLAGGTLSNPVVIALADSLNAWGLTSLSFNYRGTEASEGTATDSVEAAVEDYRAAAYALRARCAGPYVYAGYSFGAATALLAARDQAEIAALVLLAPPLGMLLSEDLAALTCPIVLLCGDDDDYAPLPALEARVSGQAHVSLDVIVGADHFFHYGGLSILQERIQTHLKRLL